MEQRLQSREEAEVVARGERRQEPPREGEDRTSADKTVAAMRQPEEKQGDAVGLPLGKQQQQQQAPAPGGNNSISLRSKVEAPAALQRQESTKGRLASSVSGGGRQHPLPPGEKFHFFLSHYQATGGLWVQK